MDAETLGHCCRRVAKWQAIRKKDWRKSAVSAVRSGTQVLNQLGDKTRNGEQDENMNAAALMQQNLQDEPDNHSECARDPEHRVIMLRKL
jgi:hypothetical protein